MKTTKLPIAILLALPVILLAIYFLTNPFAESIGSKTVSLTVLSPAQKSNINLAAESLDGVVLKPQEEFSFNALVGPRSSRRGYLKAPSYVGPDSPATLGGGICLLSSAVYQLALETGMTIVARTAHLRPIKTVQPGLDATVWYPATDLRFVNNRSYPIRLICHSLPDQLNIGLLAQSGTARDYTGSIHRQVFQPSARELQVSVIRESKGRRSLVSRDLYRLSP